MTVCYRAHMSNHRACLTNPEHSLIRSRRSCVGCGLLPGELHSNGLCASCQHPVCPTCSAVDSIDRDGRCVAFGTGCGYVRPGSRAARAVAVAERVARGEFGPVES